MTRNQPLCPSVPPPNVLDGDYKGLSNRPEAFTRLSTIPSPPSLISHRENCVTFRGARQYSTCKVFLASEIHSPFGGAIHSHTSVGQGHEEMRIDLEASL